MADIALEDLKRRLREQRASTQEPSLAEMRKALDANGARARIDARIAVEETQAGACRAEWLKPESAEADAAILYLHGGGFVGGSCVSHRPLAAAIALASGVNTLVLEYRLAPECPLPAAELDAFAAYCHLLEQKIPATRIAIAGDSAGGNLAMTTLLRAKSAGVPLPQICVLMSPWIDLDLRGESIELSATLDPTLRADALARYAAWYRHGSVGTDILAADLGGLPSMLIQVGGDEILRDDSVRLADALAAAGVSAKLEIWPGLFHVWQAFGPWLQEGRDAVAKVGAYIRSELR